MDLILILILTSTLVPSVLFVSGPLRIAVAAPFVIFFPGYVLVTALFPKKGDLDAIERIALSFVLSVTISGLIGLILNYTPWAIRLTPLIISFSSFIVITSAIALFRRWILPKEQRFGPKLRLRFPSWRGQSRLDQALALIIALSMIGAIGLLAYIIVTPKVSERFTEFYILGPEGTATDYPLELASGEQGKVILGIINREEQKMTYFVEVRIEGDKVQEVGPIGLAPEEKWEQEVTFTPLKVGEDQRIDFLLFKDEDSQPYHQLQLPLKVRGAE
jgi:uncharacterized membrane protein